MNSAKRLPGWVAALLAVAGIVSLYRGALGTGFLCDDHLFLEQARTRPLIDSLLHPGPLSNYFRPLSREICFGVLSRVGHGEPPIFHAFTAALFLAAVALVADLLLALLPPAGAVAGALYFATLPLQRVNLIWVSCCQDLLALTLALASLALFRRRQVALAALAYLGAVLSKESAAPLPIVLAAWVWLMEPAAPRASALGEASLASSRLGEAPPSSRLREVARRLAPFAVVAVVWLIGELSTRSASPGPASLRFDLSHFAAGYAHLIQSLLGLEHPPGFLASLFSHLPSWSALAFLAALALWLPSTGGRGAPGTAAVTGRPGRPASTGPPARPPARSVITLAVVWLLAFGLATGPVASIWSSYFYTLAAVGGAMVVGLLLRRLDRTGWVAFVAALLWWHAGSAGTRAFAIVERPWGWTSRLTPFYFERGAALTDSLSLRLEALEPAPPHGARFFFATLPPFAGFQMGNGALIRTLYRDPTLESRFYSQFSERTAGDRPCRFLYWDGRNFQPLYAGARDRFFQVGCDLLLIERPDGAAHAFHRGLAAGGDRRDNLYWLGWAEMMRGNRGRAEQAWAAFGARDDSLAWVGHLQLAHEALDHKRDTLATRRELIQAIESGIGRPEAHAVLGDLLMAGKPNEQKYGMLELRVACWLKPGDWLARRELVAALVMVRLDEVAAKHLEVLERIEPEWAADSISVRAARTLESRSPVGRAVAEF